MKSSLSIRKTAYARGKCVCVSARLSASDSWVCTQHGACVCKAQQCESTLPRTPGVQTHEAKLRRNYFKWKGRNSVKTVADNHPPVYSTLLPYSPSQLTCCWRSTQHRARGRSNVISSQGCGQLGGVHVIQDEAKSGRQRRVNDWLQVQSSNPGVLF